MDAINELLYKAEEMLRLNYLAFELKFFKLIRSKYYYKNPSKRLERQCNELSRERRYLLRIIEYLNDLSAEV